MPSWLDPPLAHAAFRDVSDFRLRSQVADLLLSQIDADTALLEQLRVMDYSLLLGVYFTGWGEDEWHPPSSVGLVRNVAFSLRMLVGSLCTENNAISTSVSCFVPKINVLRSALCPRLAHIVPMCHGMCAARGSGWRIYFSGGLLCRAERKWANEFAVIAWQLLAAACRRLCGQHARERADSVRHDMGVLFL